MGKVEDTLFVVQEELVSEECISHSEVSDMIHFCRHVIDVPLSFFRIEKVDAQSWNHNLAMALFLPVDGKRIEVFVLEIHHREELVHQTALEPALCILADLRVCIPAKTSVSAQVIILSYR